MFKKILFILFIVVFVSFCVFVFIKKISTDIPDTITYQGNKYVYLEYNSDIFNYGYNNINNDYYEVDVIYPISHDKWDIIYSSEDLFVRDDQIEDAIEYYADDSNYEWSVVIEEGDSEVVFPISVSNKELDYLYDMENMKRNETMLFDDIEKFGTLVKTSKDKLVYSTISLAYYKDSWYWRTETIDVTKENDPEYVIKLPDSLNKKIFDLMNSSR